MYANWRDQSSSSLLWIYGKPGSGKSTLAAMLCSSLQHTQPDYLNADFFYSTRGGPTEISHRHMLQSILFQVLDTKVHSQSLYPAFRKPFRKLKGNGREQLTWSFNELLGVLQCLTSTQKPSSNGRIEGHKFVILIDGIDESEENPEDGPERPKFLPFLSRLCSRNSIGLFKIITLSRVERDITGALQPEYSIDMRLFNGTDIERIARSGALDLWFCMTSDGQSSPPGCDSSDSDGNFSHPA
jgi:Cdc6-like AAA superfamily ATPase